MKSRTIEIKRISFSKFEFNNRIKDINDEGRASINLSLPDREDGDDNQLLLIKMEIFYPDSDYQASAEIDAVYSVLASDLPKDISQDGEFQKSLISPMVEKFRLFIGLFSEGADGAVKIPDLNFNQE